MNLGGLYRVHVMTGATLESYANSNHLMLSTTLHSPPLFSAPTCYGRLVFNGESMINPGYIYSGRAELERCFWSSLCAENSSQFRVYTTTPCCVGGRYLKTSDIHQDLHFAKGTVWIIFPCILQIVYNISLYMWCSTVLFWFCVYRYRATTIFLPCTTHSWQIDVFYHRALMHK